jgi:hypothetical protein
MFVACDLTLGPSPEGERGPNGGRIAVVRDQPLLNVEDEV